MQQDLQVRKWKTSYGQYRNCFIGDLPEDFLRVKLLPHSEMQRRQSTVRIVVFFESSPLNWIDDDRSRISLVDTTIHRIIPMRNI